MLFLWLLLGSAIVLAVALLVYDKKFRSKTEKTSYPETEKVVSIEKLYHIDDIRNGVIYKEEQALILAKLEGLNFTVMSVAEQDAREDALISIFTRVDYPIRFITNTVIADTSKEARRIAQLAANSPETAIRNYRTLYAGQLELMRTERWVTTQQTFIVIPGKDEEEARNRLHLIASSLQQQTAILVTPLTTTEQVYDAIQDMLLPNQILRPSEIALEHVHVPIHFAEKEIAKYGANI